MSNNANHHHPLPFHKKKIKGQPHARMSTTITSMTTTVKLSIRSLVMIGLTIVIVTLMLVQFQNSRHIHTRVRRGDTVVVLEEELEDEDNDDSLSFLTSPKIKPSLPNPFLVERLVLLEELLTTQTQTQKNDPQQHPKHDHHHHHHPPREETETPKGWSPQQQQQQEKGRRPTQSTLLRQKTTTKHNNNNENNDIQYSGNNVQRREKRREQRQEQDQSRWSQKQEDPPLVPRHKLDDNQRSHSKNDNNDNHARVTVSSSSSSSSSSATQENDDKDRKMKKPLKTATTTGTSIHNNDDDDENSSRPNKGAQEDQTATRKKTELKSKQRRNDEEENKKNKSPDAPKLVATSITGTTTIPSGSTPMVNHGTAEDDDTQKTRKKRFEATSFVTTKTRTMTTSSPPAVVQNPPRTTTTTTTSQSIRSWGCGLTATPFIFVHIPKAGGGSIRRRIAQAAFNYTRTKQEWFQPDRDESYYPIRHPRHSSNNKNNDNETPQRKATFCNSGHLNFMPRRDHDSFEGTRQCRAATPIGQALACPQYMAPNNEDEDNWYCGGNGQANTMQAADIVYTGHNGFGTELHWLPKPYLEQWWQQTTWMKDAKKKERKNASTVTTTASSAKWIDRQWNRLDGEHYWCGNFTRPLHFVHNKTLIRELQIQMDQCAQENLIEKVDHRARQAVLRPQQERQIKNVEEGHSSSSSSSVSLTSAQQRGMAWSSVYASLPVLRVVMIRQPFALFASHYSWLNLGEKGIACENITSATTGAGNSNMYELLEQEQQKQNRDKKDKEDNDDDNHDDLLLIHGTSAPGWVSRLALDYIYWLCGSDCRVRHLTQEATLEELVAQTEHNLRHAFTVVGILELGQDLFFDMIGTRVDYMANITRHKNSKKRRRRDNKRKLETKRTEKEKELKESRRRLEEEAEDDEEEDLLHSTQGADPHCKDKFKDVDFQQALIQASPEVAAICHLYQVALEVNQYQQDELQQCRRQSSTETKSTNSNLALS